jgi:hypothetical protein
VEQPAANAAPSPRHRRRLLQQLRHLQPPSSRRAEDYTQAPRNETVIFDIDGGKVADPTCGIRSSLVAAVIMAFTR